MVEVIDQATRDLANQRLSEANQARQRLDQQQRQVEQIRSRNISQLAQRNSALQNIQNAAGQIGGIQTELGRLSQLPTAQEYLDQYQGQFKNQINEQLQQARAAVYQAKNNGIPLAYSLQGLDPQIRQYAIQLNQGVTADQILSAAQKQLGQSLTPTGQSQVLQNYNLFNSGITPQEFDAGQSLFGRGSPPSFQPSPSGQLFTEIPFTKIPQTTQPSFLDTIQQAKQKIGSEVSNFNVYNFASRVQNAALGPPTRAFESLLGTIPNKAFAGPQSNLFPGNPEISGKIVKSALGATYQDPYGSLVIGGLFGPIFSSGTAAQNIFEEAGASAAGQEIVLDDVTGEYISRNELAQRNLQRVLESGAEKIKTDTGKTIDLKVITRDLINKAGDNPDLLAKLENFYSDTGRSQLFKDILEQEKGSALPEGATLGFAKTDIPVTIEGAGPILGITSDILKPTESIYAGQGTYEKTNEVANPFLSNTGEINQNQNPFLATENILFNQNIQNPFFSENQLSVQRSLQEQRQNQLFIQPEITKQNQFLSQQQSPKQQQPQNQRDNLGLGVALGLATQTAQQTKQKQPQKQVPRLGQPSPPREALGEPGKIPHPFTPESPIPSLGRLKQLIEKASNSKAFAVYVKRQGAYKKIADRLPFGLAVKTGTDEVLDTLAANFKVVGEPGKKPKGKDIDFVPGIKEFRDYQIKRGKKVPLAIGEFIERKNKRITSSGEIKEILKFQASARKARGGTRSKKASKFFKK